MNLFKNDEIVKLSQCKYGLKPNVLPTVFFNTSECEDLVNKQTKQSNPVCTQNKTIRIITVKRSALESFQNANQILPVAKKARLNESDYAKIISNHLAEIASLKSELTSLKTDMLNHELECTRKIQKLTEENEKLKSALLGSQKTVNQQASSLRKFRAKIFKSNSILELIDENSHVVREPKVF